MSDKLKAAAEMALEATSHSKLISDLMNPHTPKTEREHAAVREIEALRQALDQLPDTTKMIEPEELVCICGAIWQGQELICPPKCLEEGIEREMPIDRGAWSDVPDATKWVDELRGDDEEPAFTDQGVKFTCGDCPQGGCCEVVEPPNSVTRITQPVDLPLYPVAPPQHAEVIKAWAQGAFVEYLNGVGKWVPKNHPEWYHVYQYRVKPVDHTDLCDNG